MLQSVFSPETFPEGVIVVWSLSDGKSGCLETYHSLALKREAVFFPSSDLNHGWGRCLLICRFGTLICLTYGPPDESDKPHFVPPVINIQYLSFSCNNCGCNKPESTLIHCFHTAVAAFWHPLSHAVTAQRWKQFPLHVNRGRFACTRMCVWAHVKEVANRFTTRSSLLSGQFTAISSLFLDRVLVSFSVKMTHLQLLPDLKLWFADAFSPRQSDSSVASGYRPQAAGLSSGRTPEVSHRWTYSTGRSDYFYIAILDKFGCVSGNFSRALTHQSVPTSEAYDWIMLDNSCSGRYTAWHQTLICPIRWPPTPNSDPWAHKRLDLCITTVLRK